MYRGFRDGYRLPRTSGQETEGRSGDLLYVENDEFRLDDGRILRRISVNKPKNANNQGILTANLFPQTGDIEFFLFPSYYGWQVMRKTRIKHPDLFARDFARFAINTFIDEWVRITQLNCQWTPATTNHMQFMNLISQGYSETDSAENTRTGQNIARSMLGFRCTSVGTIKDRILDVFVTFSR